MQAMSFLFHGTIMPCGVINVTQDKMPLMEEAARICQNCGEPIVGAGRGLYCHRCGSACAMNMIMRRSCQTLLGNGKLNATMKQNLGLPADICEDYGTTYCTKECSQRSIGFRSGCPGPEECEPAKCNWPCMCRKGGAS